MCSIIPENFKETKMKKSLNIIPVSALLLTFAWFLITGCYTSPPGEILFSQAPSRPSSQQKQILTKEDIDNLIEKGDIEYENGRFSTAKDIYYRVLFAMPDPSVYVLVSYGACLANLQSYENAIDIFNIALKKDPDNEVIKENIAICRQYIARQTEEQRQFQLEQRRQQQENLNNLISSLNSLSSSVGNLKSNQGQSGSPSQIGGASGGNNQAVSSGTSSSASSNNNADEASMRRSYNTRAKAAEDVYFQLQRAELNNESKSTLDRLRDSLRSHQRDLKSYREECKRKGVTISPSLYETKWP
jgi:tetratricopeptide (TPR) repeat protein